MATMKKILELEEKLNSISRDIPSIHIIRESSIVRKRLFESTPVEKWITEDKVDFNLEEEKPIPKIKSEYSAGTWSTNEPFVVHFLLDGFLSNSLGNNTQKVTERFIELLDKTGTEWALEMSEEIKRGKSYGSYKEGESKKSKRFDASVPLKEYVDEEIKGIGPIKHNMIVGGGYKRSNGGHATAFRFLPSKRQIIFINSGEGLENHPRYEDFRKLYYFWQLDSDEEFQDYARTMLGAIECSYKRCLHLSS
jgi:hypothetical protein